MKINASESFCIVQHKGRWVIAITHLDKSWSRVFKGNQKLNRTEAIQLINFLSYYINLVKPTQATMLQASIKASSNRIVKNSSELLSIAMESEK